MFAFRLCLYHFKYSGKRQIVREQAPKKASTLPAKLQPPYSSGRMSTATDSYSGELHTDFTVCQVYILY